jgi:hypothetical protein
MKVAPVGFAVNHHKVAFRPLPKTLMSIAQAGKLSACASPAKASDLVGRIHCFMRRDKSVGCDSLSQNN